MPRITKLFPLSVVFMGIIVGGHSMADDQPAVHPKFSEAIIGIAADVAQYVKAETDTDGGIGVGSWQGPGGGGSMVSQALREKLGEAGVAINKIGGYSVSGNYEQDKNELGKHVTVLTASIKNPSGNEVHVLRRRLVTDDRVAIELFGATVDNTAASDAAERIAAEEQGKKPGETPIDSTAKTQSQIRQTIANPKTTTLNVSAGSSGGINSLVRFASESPYGVELLVRDANGGEYAPCAIAVDNGLSHTDIKRTQVYAIKIHNDSGAPVGATVSIDGINIFTFSDNPHWKKLGKVLIRPGGGVIKGWAGQGSSVNEFTIVEYGESAIAELGLFEGMGSITVVFHQALEKKSATGRGKSVDNELKLAHATFSDNVLGSVSIKYVRESTPTDLPPE